MITFPLVTDRVSIPDPVELRGYSLNLWETAAPWRYRWHDRWYTVPARFVCDLYSIPRPFRWWRQPNRGVGNEAAVAHDFLRRFRRLIGGLSVRDTDRCFFDIMLAMEFGRSAYIKYFVVALASPIVRGSGDGTPPRDVRRAMTARGHDWTLITEEVAG